MHEHDKSIDSPGDSYHHQFVMAAMAERESIDPPFDIDRVCVNRPGLEYGTTRFTTLKPVVAAVAICCLAPTPVFPSNGLNVIGFGAESVGMGGADVAVARDTSATSTNPAGIAQIRGNEVDVYGAVVYPLSVAHRDSLGNDAEVSNRRIFLGGGGYTRRSGDSPVAFGIGIFAQGGAGNVYKDLATPYGTRDELSSAFRIGKASPAAAWQISPSLFLGASLPIVYADFSQNVFPDTSSFNPTDPSGTFFGTRIENLSGAGVGVKVGILYKIGDTATVGAAYGSKVRIPLDGGTVVVDMSSIGLGKVTYRDARLEGLALPQEFGMGVAVRPVKPLLLSVEIDWLDWSGSLKTSTLRAGNPDNPAAPPVLEKSSALNWKDQYVIALGAAYDLTERVILRAGYNYGRNPIPNDTTSPLLAAFAENHVTFGAGYAMGHAWRTDLGIEYALNKKVTYNNPDLPFGPGAEEEGETLSVLLMVSRRW